MGWLLRLTTYDNKGLFTILSFYLKIKLHSERHFWEIYLKKYISKVAHNSTKKINNIFTILMHINVRFEKWNKKFTAINKGKI